MKARLWQTLFLLNVLITSEVSFAEDANKDVRDLKRTNIMSVLYQQTAAERLASSLQHLAQQTSIRQSFGRPLLECLA